MQQRIQRFNRILKIREDDRRTEQGILAEQRREEQSVLDRLSALEDEKTTAIKEFGGMGDHTVSCTELWFQRQFIDAINSGISDTKISLNDVRLRISGTEARLVERHKDVRVMETYIGHLKEADFKEQLDAEQVDLDDIANLRFASFSRAV